jgi:hypothetical protein
MLTDDDPLYSSVCCTGVQVLAHDVSIELGTPEGAVVHWGKCLPVVFAPGVADTVDARHLAQVIHWGMGCVHDVSMLMHSHVKCLQGKTRAAALLPRLLMPLPCLRPMAQPASTSRCTKLISRAWHAEV